MDELNGPIDRLSISQWWKHILYLRQCEESGSDPFLLRLVRKRFSTLCHVFKRAQIDSPEVPDASLRTKLQRLLPSIAQGKTFASTNELNHTLLLQIYDSIFKVDKGGRPQWYIRAADPHRFTEGFLALSPALANRLPSLKPMATAITLANRKQKSKTPSYYLAKWEFDTSLGTVSHKYLELMARKTMNPTQFDSAHPTVRETVTKMKNHLDTLLQKGWEFVGVEVIVPEFKNHCCGTIDLILRSMSNKTHFLLIDYKTRKKKDIRKKHGKDSTLKVPNSKLNSYAIQLYLYRRAFINLVDPAILKSRTRQFNVPINV